MGHDKWFQLKRCTPINRLYFYIMLVRREVPNANQFYMIQRFVSVKNLGLELYERVVMLP